VARFVCDESKKGWWFGRENRITYQVDMCRNAENYFSYPGGASCEFGCQMMGHDSIGGRIM
jgi:hypothetical protein